MIKIEDYSSSTGFYPESGQDVIETVTELVSALSALDGEIAWNTLEMTVERMEEPTWAGTDEFVSLTLSAKAVVQ